MSCACMAEPEGLGGQTHIVTAGPTQEVAADSPFFSVEVSEHLKAQRHCSAGIDFKKTHGRQTKN